MRMRKSEMRMRQSDKKTLAIEYEFRLLAEGGNIALWYDRDVTTSSGDV